MLLYEVYTVCLHVFFLQVMVLVYLVVYFIGSQPIKFIIPGTHWTSGELFEVIMYRKYNNYCAHKFINLNVADLVLE